MSVTYGLEQTLIKPAPLWERRENMAKNCHAKVNILKLVKTLIRFGHIHFTDERKTQRDGMIM